MDIWQALSTVSAALARRMHTWAARLERLAQRWEVRAVARGKPPVDRAPAEPRTWPGASLEPPEHWLARVRQAGAVQWFRFQSDPSPRHPESSSTTPVREETKPGSPVRRRARPHLHSKARPSHPAQLAAAGSSPIAPDEPQRRPVQARRVQQPRLRLHPTPTPTRTQGAQNSAPASNSSGGESTTTRQQPTILPGPGAQQHHNSNRFGPAVPNPGAPSRSPERRPTAKTDGTDSIPEATLEISSPASRDTTKLAAPPSAQIKKPETGREPEALPSQRAGSHAMLEHDDEIPQALSPSWSHKLLPDGEHDHKAFHVPAPDVTTSPPAPEAVGQQPPPQQLWPSLPPWPPSRQPARPTPSVPVARQGGTLRTQSEAMKGHWPELPESARIEAGAYEETSLEDVTLQSWRRRERLDREQEGDPWSASRS